MKPAGLKPVPGNTIFSKQFYSSVKAIFYFASLRIEKAFNEPCTMIEFLASFPIDLVISEVIDSTERSLALQRSVTLIKEIYAGQLLLDADSLFKVYLIYHEEEEWKL